MTIERIVYKSSKRRYPKDGDVAVFYAPLKNGSDYKYRYWVYDFDSNTYLVQNNKSTGLHHLQSEAKDYDGVIIRCSTLPHLIS